MNTKILLAMVGAIAFSACGKNRPPKAEIVEESVAPSTQRATVGSKPPKHRAPGPALPNMRSPSGSPGFRTPDATKELYDENSSFKISTSGAGRSAGGSSLSVSPPPSNLPVVPAGTPEAAPIGQTE